MIKSILCTRDTEFVLVYDGQRVSSDVLGIMETLGEEVLHGTAPSLDDLEWYYLDLESGNAFRIKQVGSAQNTLEICDMMLQLYYHNLTRSVKYDTEEVLP